MQMETVQRNGSKKGAAQSMNKEATGVGHINEIWEVKSKGWGMLIQ